MFLVFAVLKYKNVQDSRNFNISIYNITYGALQIRYKLKGNKEFFSFFVIKGGKIRAELFAPLLCIIL
jgi:hypothetical protein